MNLHLLFRFYFYYRIIRFYNYNFGFNSTFFLFYCFSKNRAVFIVDQEFMKIIYAYKFPIRIKSGLVLIPLDVSNS